MKRLKNCRPLFFVSFMAIIVLSLPSCYMPVNALYETARPLGEGTIELAGMYTGYSAEDVQKNFGFRGGFGISEKADIKIRYEYLQNSYETGQYLSLIPKYSFVCKNNYAIAVPLSMYSVKDISDIGYEEKGSEEYFSIAPTFLVSLDLKAGKIELTSGFRTEIFVDAEIKPIYGISSGLGFSSDLNKWAIRPEIGFSFGEDGGAINLGIGACIYLNRFRSRKY